MIQDMINNEFFFVYDIDNQKITILVISPYAIMSAGSIMRTRDQLRIVISVEFSIHTRFCLHFFSNIGKRSVCIEGSAGMKRRIANVSLLKIPADIANNTHIRSRRL